MSFLRDNIEQKKYKRGVDILGAIGGLVIFSPLIILIALLLKLNLGSPILFRQLRPGHNGRLFNLFKFRTMTNAKDKNGHFLPDEKRLTPFGNFLRSASLDELPTLFNVLIGDMSLVGPRPLLVEYLERYSTLQARRHEVRPGITGWAQVKGRNAISWEEKFELDIWYIENWSFGLDIKILLITFLKVIRRQDIHADGYATMPEFLGSKEKMG